MDFLQKTTTSITSHKPKDECDQENDFKTQLLIIAGVSVIIGLVMCLAGYRLFKLILFLTGFFVGFFTSYVICSLYLTDHIEGNAADYKDQIYLGLSFCVGLIGGLLTLCLYYVGLFVLGATLGWFAGMALLPLFKSEAHYLADNMWLPYSICTGCAIFAGLLMLCIQKVIIILSTAFLGSLLFINGIDYYVEKGRVVTYTVNIMQGSHYYLPNCWYTWLVISLLPILFIVGVIVQHVKTSKGVDHRLASGRVLVVDSQMIEMQNDEAETPLLNAEYT
ncbi:transmembrane protein 198-like isoform X2 [Dendronephthya gigantea]|nr:transmembrane protein 198-like isoform X2 [Dendronephthya gigantea]XP_028407574.1 transmembrane protein 198-like isoform X2 [Dendronephthya gigantea]